MLFYRRKLPHFIPNNATFFVTYCLAGSMPFDVIRRLQEEHAIEMELMKKLHDGKTSYQQVVRNMHKRNFARVDAYLDNSLNEPYWLKHEAIASLVSESLQFIAKDWVELVCFTIMPNHVHVLLRPKLQKPGLINILQRHKSFTGKMAIKFYKEAGNFGNMKVMTMWYETPKSLIGLYHIF